MKSATCDKQEYKSTFRQVRKIKKENVSKFIIP